MEEKILAIWLSEALGTGSIYGKLLVEKYGSFSEIYHLSEKDYEQIGIKGNSAVMAKLLDKSIGNSEKSYGFCSYNYFSVIEYTSAQYPKRLRAIKNPPPVLFARGRMIDFDDNVCIGVVGTRSYSDAGWNSTYKIASGIAGCGAVVVTGLAGGIDTAATKAALASSGFCVGVLGSGVEKIYPSENRELFEEMYTRGLVISELPPFSDITGKYFPVRNRIISGLCNGVLVGEGSLRSGAMLTAAHACEQGRHVFAIPADISNPESTGVNKLIREGATPVFGAWDVLDKFAYLYPHRLKNVCAADEVDVPKERSTKRVRVLKGKMSAQQEKTSEVQNTAYDDKTVKTVSKDTVKNDAKHISEKIKKEAPEKTELKFEKVYESGEIFKKPAEKQTVSDAVTENLGELEKKVYSHIARNDFCVADAIASEINEDPISVTVAITTLELSGLIRTEGPKVMKA